MEKVNTYSPNKHKCIYIGFNVYNSEPGRKWKYHCTENSRFKKCGVSKRNISPPPIRSWHFLGGSNKILEETILGKILPRNCECCGTNYPHSTICEIISDWVFSTLTLLQPFARHLVGKMVIQKAHECSSLLKHSPDIYLTSFVGECSNQLCFTVHALKSSTARYPPK